MMRINIPCLMRGLVAALPTLGVALFGLSALGWLMLTTPAAQAGMGQVGAGRVGAGQVGVIIAPWSQGGMAAAAGFDLPIIDLRWAGHLVVVDVSGAPHARRALQSAGYLVINTDVPSGCLL